MAIKMEGGAHWYQCQGSTPKSQHDATLREARKEKLYASITTVDKATFKNDFLDAWKLNELAEAAYDYPPMEHESKETYAQRVYEVSLTKSLVAADFGKEIHDAIEHYPQMPLDPKLHPWIEKFAPWYEENIDMPLASECILFDHALGLAGRCDKVAIGKGKFEGKIILPDWKGLCINTEIPTISGWKKMKDVQVGDVIYDNNGQPTKVIGKSQTFNKPCYRIIFDDKTEVVCDNTHEWSVHVRHHGKKHSATYSCDELCNLFHQKAAITIANAKPIHDGFKSQLPIDPYCLGAWLGDGTEKEGKISLSPFKEKIVDRFRFYGWHIYEMKNKPYEFYIYGFVSFLKAYGLYGNKHIPKEYLRSSVSNRILLLQGLMDTDGTWNKTRNQAEFNSVDKNLSDGVYELVVSLGMRANKYVGISNGFGKTTTYYRITFTPNGLNPFKLNSKNQPLAELKKSGTKISGRRKIISLESIASVPTQCIAVDSPGRLFLCTKSMVPTHNTQRVKVNKKGKKEPAFYDSWCRQLAFYCVSYAKANGCWPDNIPTAISVVIDSNEPDTPFAKVWTPEEIRSAYEDVVLAAYSFYKKRQYWPQPEGPIEINHPKIPLPYS